MKNTNFAKNIAELRKKKGYTQEQFAQLLNISAQAVSKWETDTCQPDTQMLPLIADCFGVSIDYLFYGNDFSYDDIFEKAFQKICVHSQMSKESYEDALKLFAHAHHGISKGNVKGKGSALRDEPSHISNENGLSLLSGKGYGALITRNFFENINKSTVDFAMTFLPALCNRNQLIICLEIIAMSDISFSELLENTGLSSDEIINSIDALKESKIIIEKESKHKSLGFTYEINSMYHTCLCILFATIEMQNDSLNGISCCMGVGDYPIKL